MTSDREYLRQTAERYVANENHREQFHEGWSPSVRDVARLASEYLIVLDELQQAESQVQFLSSALAEWETP